MFPVAIRTYCFQFYIISYFVYSPHKRVLCTACESLPKSYQLQYIVHFVYSRSVRKYRWFLCDCEGSFDSPESYNLYHNNHYRSEYMFSYMYIIFNKAIIQYFSKKQFLKTVIKYSKDDRNHCFECLLKSDNFLEKMTTL